LSASLAADETNSDDELALILTNKLESEHAKREEWKLENQRRRHNYVPLCIELLKGLARQQEGQVLKSLMAQAQQKRQAAAANKNTHKKQMSK
jgi:ubiquitin carboxyl-terminal hydrolase L5